MYFCFIDYAKATDCEDHNKLWKILEQLGIPDHLRNLYPGQEETDRTGQGTTEWLQTGKRSTARLYIVTCLFKLYADYIMWNTGLYEAQAGIKNAKRNINNLRYAGDNTLMQKLKKN